MSIRQREPSSPFSVVELPNVLRLAWLLFIQPIQLNRILSTLRIEPTGSAIAWWKQGDLGRKLLVRMAGILVVGMPLLVLVIASICVALGIHISWVRLAVGTAVGVALGTAGSLVLGAAGSTVLGVTGGIVGGLWAGMVGGLTEYTALVGVGSIGVALGLAFAAFAIAGRVVGGAAEGIGEGVAVAILMGLAFTLVGSVAYILSKRGYDYSGFGVAFGLVAGVSFGVAYFRIPSYLVEATYALLLSFMSAERAYRLLPYRYHDVIWFPLPGLPYLIAEAAKTDPPLAQTAIDECSATLGQRGIADRALADLQINALTDIAHDRCFATLKQGGVPFLPSNPPEDSAWAAFVNVANELCAAQINQHQRYRAQLLGRAEQLLGELPYKLLQERRSDYLERLLLSVAQQWLTIVKDEQARLKQEQVEHPRLPECFIAGPALRKEPGTPFKGRRDLARLVDHELASEQRGPLVLWGQRRMGKTSFLQLAPDLLGGGTKICIVNFQSLSGSVHRAAPYRWVCDEIAAMMGVESPPEGPWGVALDWLTTVESRLAATKERLLIAIDEVERLEDEIRAGQTNHDFLDFARAAGDRLLRVRLLLVSGLPLQRLGAHWVDRIISAKLYELGYLETDAAEELVRRPIPEFPDIYPAGGVEKILQQTNCHPYLIQLVCDQLVRRLNGKQQLQSSMDDIEWAIDESFSKTALFSELWDRQMQPREQQWLRSLAQGSAVIEPDGALRELEQHQFVLREQGQYRIAVPMFESWIRDNRLDVAHS